MATVEEREKKVELSISDRFQGGFCCFYNIPLPSNDKCLYCVHGRKGLDGEPKCRLGARLDKRRNNYESKRINNIAFKRAYG